MIKIPKKTVFFPLLMKWFGKYLVRKHSVFVVIVINYKIEAIKETSLFLDFSDSYGFFCV